MNHKNFIICDSEEPYAVHLMEWVERRPELYVQVRVFTSAEETLQFARSWPVAVLLIEECFEKELRDQIPADEVFVLVREGEVSVSEREHILPKYRQAGFLLDQVIETCLEQKKNPIFRKMQKSGRKLLAVYSPAPDVRQTRAAITLGKKIAEKENVLYLNLQEYPGFSAVMEKTLERTLEDLVYFVRQGDRHIGIRAGTMAGQTGSLSYLEPIKSAADLKAVTWEEWQNLISQILEESIFDTVIVEPGESIQGLPEMLEWCREIYVYIGTDEVSEAKMVQFQDNLRLFGKEEILKRIRREDINGFE